MTEKVMLAVLAHPDDETFGMGGTLALYARRGVKVHLICATRGEVGDVDEKYMQGYANVADLRVDELRCAAGLLGLAGVHFLNYRDSGMPGSPDNKHPNALAAASLDQVTGDVVAVIRKVKPQVVLTFDPIGGYRHPDHIAIHQAAVKAFQAASDPQQYPDSLPAFQPQKLYFHTMPHGWLRLIVKVLPLFGRDPRKFGRNADIDLVSIAEVSFPTHAVVDYRPVAAVRDQASACHASQGGTTMAGGLFGRIRNLFGANERFMRAFPEPRRGEAVERDLFANISG